MDESALVMIEHWHSKKMAECAGQAKTNDFRRNSAPLLSRPRPKVVSHHALERSMQTRSRHGSHAPKFEPPAPKFLRMPLVVRMTGLGRSTIYRLIAENKFPGPVRVGDRAVAWRQVDLDEWSEGRLPSPH